MGRNREVVGRPRESAGACLVFSGAVRLTGEWSWRHEHCSGTYPAPGSSSHKPIRLRPEVRLTVHECMEHRQSIGQTIRHHQVLVVPRHCAEGHLPSPSWMQIKLYAHPQVQLGKKKTGPYGAVQWRPGTNGRG